MDCGFTPNQWLIVGLVLLFGLLVGAALAAGGGRKHKTRYKEESHRRAELERENERLRKELRHADTDTARDRDRLDRDRTHADR